MQVLGARQSTARRGVLAVLTSHCDARHAEAQVERGRVAMSLDGGRDGAFIGAPWSFVLDHQFRGRPPPRTVRSFLSTSEACGRSVGVLVTFCVIFSKKSVLCSHP